MQSYKHLKTWFILLISSFLLAACASNLPYQTDDQKIRRGWIVSFYTKDALQKDLLQADAQECLHYLSEAELSAKRYVNVGYVLRARMYTVVAEVPETVQVKIDDSVEFRLGDCSRGEIGRVFNVIP